MSNRPFEIFGWTLLCVAFLGLQVLDWGALNAFTTWEWVGLLFLIGLGVVSEYLALQIKIGESGSTSSSITFILIFACVILFGPAATVLSATSIWFVSQVVVRRKPLSKWIFNVAQIAIATTLSGWVFDFLGGVPSTSTLKTFDLVAFVGFGGIFIVSNLLMVSAAITLLEKLPFREIMGRLAGPKASHMAYDLLVSPVALLVAVLFIEFKIWGLVGVALTLFFIRRSYLTNFQLQQALGDLLKVLVKAIETRDPYTSGHSMRVAALARKISTSMGLSSRKIEEVETAALLHDIGKIDEIFNDILKKPTGLSEEERKIIESHAIKGAELLASLTSVSDEIIASVRHHHERVDGKGYPDRIAAHAIPLGARIIKVCDAIDAMLSDRPYRQALKLKEVKEQLVTYAGVQFDVEVVSVCVRGSLLADHASELSLRHLRGGASMLGDGSESAVRGVAFG